LGDFFYKLIWSPCKGRIFLCWRQGCQIFNSPIYQNVEKYTKLPQNIPNDHRYQMAVQKDQMCIDFIPTSSITRPIQNWPKLRYLVWKYTIWQPWAARISHQPVNLIVFGAETGKCASTFVFESGGYKNISNQKFTLSLFKFKKCLSCHLSSVNN
jgi:hypothetical protein